ncbi:hypothetical protein SAMN04489723_101259 [Algoriphagus aquimarinus]|uniref:Uncharacterized protein n=1 Tax=Algoriphagus aquimarinus TaxID=237018 RepID=A0A1I0VLR6_9BACT|nr:hypothetical protein SAMN04489723_101259 [Algoriphagus aquimarinus]
MNERKDESLEIVKVFLVIFSMYIRFSTSKVAKAM